MPELYPHQQAAVRFLRLASSALVGDEMGLGKTAETIASLQDGGSFPALVACPNSVKDVWLRELRTWAPEVRVEVAPSGTVRAEQAARRVQAGEADVLVSNWESLRRLSRLAPFGSIALSMDDVTPKVLNEIEWGAVVADEAHRAASPTAKQTRALWAAGKSADRRIALTGTPVVNSAADLWAIMHFVCPEEYPVKSAWLDRYAIMEFNPHSGGFDVKGLREDRREELDRYFLARFIRRTKAEVLPDLPPKVYERRDVFLSGKQRKAYDTMRKDMLADIDGGVMAATSVLTSALRLRQFASSYAELQQDRQQATRQLTLEDVGQELESVDLGVRLAEPSAKLDALEEVLQELGNRQAVIFADSRQLIDLAFARLSARHTCSLLTGPVSTAERAAGVANFQAGYSQYLLATTGAGGEGITLTAADTAIFLQRPWSLVHNQQAEDRLHRIGQEAQSVTYIDLVAKDTIEEHVFEALQEKSDRLQDVVRDPHALKEWLK